MASSFNPESFFFFLITFKQEFYLLSLTYLELIFAQDLRDLT